MATLRVQSRWLLAAVAAMLVGCLSPTMPMPPPSRPEIEGPDERGVVTLSGHAPPESRVYADNESTGYGYSQRTNAVTGAYRFPIIAGVGDTISMFYRVDYDDSMTLKFVIPSVSAYPRGTGGALGTSNPVAGAAGVAGSTGAAGGPAIDSGSGGAAGLGGI